MSDRTEELLGSLTELTAVVTLPVGILAGIFVGGQAAGIVFVVGWLLIVPALAVVQDSSEPFSSDDESPSETPLEELKRRYANGEIDEPEFERRLERLVALDEIPESATETTTTDGVGGSEESEERLRET